MPNRGLQITIADNARANPNIGGPGGEWPTIRILNPNDGIVYVTANGSADSVNWDYKIPSQSFAKLPGPFANAGLFYQDQSGTLRPGNIILYTSNETLEEPEFVAIGRSLQTGNNVVDIPEGLQPSNPPSGILRLWADTVNALHELTSGGADQIVSCPSGSLLDFAGAVAPAGWLLCDGSAVSRSVYATLFAAIGTVFGAGDGSTTFNVPDLRGRASIGTGTGAGLSPRTLGTKSGEETHQLSIAEMPAHTHTISPGTASNVTPGGNGPYYSTPGTDTGSTGGGGFHNNMQPFIVLTKIIKT